MGPETVSDNIDRPIDTRTSYGLWIGTLMFLLPLSWFVYAYWWPFFQHMKSDLSLDSEGLPIISQFATFAILAASIILPAWIWGVWSAAVGFFIAGRRIGRGF